MDFTTRADRVQPEFSKIKVLERERDVSLFCQL